VILLSVPPTASARSEKPVADHEERVAPQSVFAGTGIGFVLEANGNEVPKNGAQMMKALEKLGDFVQLPVAFSAVALHSGLVSPRVILTPRPSMTELPLADGKRDPADPAPGSEPALTTLSRGALTRPNLVGRLYIAANMEKAGGVLKVKTFEFISWNSRKQKFDFGFIECDEVEPQIRVVDGVKCFSCHKNRGPILGQGPWSNTTHNDVVRTAMMSALGVTSEVISEPVDAAEGGAGGNLRPTAFVKLGGDLGQPRRLDTGFVPSRVRGQPNAVRPVTFDGIPVLLPQGPAVDAAVRIGGEMARDREVFRLMTKTADGRRGLIVLLGAIVAPGDLDKNNDAVRSALNREFAENYPRFAEKVLPIQKASSSTLADFNPSGSQGKLVRVTAATGGGWGSGPTLSPGLRIAWSGSTKQVTDYSTQRADGQHGMPSAHQPSNPKAFVPVVASLGTPSAAVNATGLARLIGLTEADRTFFAEMLAEAVDKISKRKLTAPALAKEVFSGPQFAPALIAGEIPDREDFKDRFVRGVNEALKAQSAEPLALVRADYASGPNVARRADADAPVVPTTACLRCHDVRGTGKAGFSPIPMLAFDPFDKADREAWVKGTPDAKTRVPVLARMQKRLHDDKDMPPEDSAEYDTFRTKDAGGFDAVKEWLDAELKSAKG